MARKTKKRRTGLIILGKIDYSILIITAILLVWGLLTLLSASAPKSLSESGNSYSYVKKQIMAMGLGLGAMVVLSFVDYRVYAKLKWLIYFVCGAMLLLVGLFGVGDEAGIGARRWFDIGPASVQPSEFAKVGYILFYAAYFSEEIEKGTIKKFWRGVLFPIILLAPMVGFVYFLQNHFSATILMVAITFVQMFAAGANIGYMFGIGGVGGMGALAYLTANGGFRLERIMTWRNIESDKIGKGYQINQSLYAIGSGGPFGRGFGNSNQKYLYLPESENDFIFSILAEEMGFVGCFGVIILYLVFIWRGLFLATRAEDKLGSLIATGIVVMIGLQALVNIAVVTNTIPVTGMPLPFFSYGGSAMIANLMAIGILLSISRHAKKEERDR